MRSKRILLLLLIFFSGCATASGIKKAYNKINVVNGVSSRDAKIIAQKICLDNYFCRAKYVVSFPQVEQSLENNENWLVSFKIKDVFLTDYDPYSVIINIRTGKILFSGIKNVTSKSMSD